MNRRAFLKGVLGILGCGLLGVPLPKPTEAKPGSAENPLEPIVEVKEKYRFAWEPNLDNYIAHNRAVSKRLREGIVVHPNHELNQERMKQEVCTNCHKGAQVSIPPKRRGKPKGDEPRWVHFKKYKSDAVFSYTKDAQPEITWLK